ncbi:MAG: mechanosensitive ion channel family protein [Xanthomonadaceae bacterium]|nr:mechanosensitive ion channel family protein [Xanthomonadaceae bacterium]
MSESSALAEVFAAYPWIKTVLVLAAVVLAAWIANWLTKRVLVRGLRQVLRYVPLAREQPEEPNGFGVVSRLANIVPALVVWHGIAAVPGLPEAAVVVVRNVSTAFVIVTAALALSAFLSLVNALYQRRPDAARRPIKGYLQVVKIALYVVASILAIATLLDRSPVILLSGLGAMAAVLMLVFQDTLLSLVASVQISTNDIVRVGDWIEMPQLNADGEVIDIALHTVKVQNWDKTITTIPTKRLISESFKNWRGMRESGGRRIKRSLYLDQNSVYFLSEEERRRLRRFYLLHEYLGMKERELEEWNARLAEWSQEPANRRRVTNLGTFRAYVERYLRNHPGINQNMTLMVRHLAPGATGLPLEIYCFTRSVVWTEYEAVQADIFDHLLAILPEFGLRVFQQPAGADVQALGEAFRALPAAQPLALEAEA